MEEHCYLPIKLIVMTGFKSMSIEEAVRLVFVWTDTYVDTPYRNVAFSKLVAKK